MMEREERRRSGVYEEGNAMINREGKRGRRGGKQEGAKRVINTEGMHPLTIRYDPCTGILPPRSMTLFCNYGSYVHIQLACLQ